MAALLFGDRIQGHAVNGCRGGGMDILPGAEGSQHRLVLRHVGHDAQLDLGIIHREQHVSGAGNKASPHLAADLGADGDVL